MNKQHIYSYVPHSWSTEIVNLSVKETVTLIMKTIKEALKAKQKLVSFSFENSQHFVTAKNIQQLLYNKHYIVYISLSTQADSEKMPKVVMYVDLPRSIEKSEKNKFKLQPKKQNLTVIDTQDHKEPS